MSDLSQSSQIRERITHSPRSLCWSRGCFTDRRRTWIWWRRARFSKTSAWRDLMTDAAVRKGSVIIYMRLNDRGCNVKRPNVDGFMEGTGRAEQGGKPGHGAGILDVDRPLTGNHESRAWPSGVSDSKWDLT